MHGFRRNDPRLVLALVLGVMARDARAENLRDAWAIALGTNQQLQASRQTSAAAGQELASSRSARLPQIQTLNAQAFLTNPISVPSSSGQPKAAPGGQEQFTISAVAAIVPIYTGGRIRNTIASNSAQWNASKADEATTALDLKLEVARAYVDVLRASRGVAVAESNVVSLTAQARDVGNLVTQGRGIRNDLLAAQVARANAQQRKIQVRNRLSIAWATYNRYLCRPMDTVVPLEELAQEPPPPPSGEPPTGPCSCRTRNPSRWTRPRSRPWSITPCGIDPSWPRCPSRRGRSTPRPTSSGPAPGPRSASWPPTSTRTRDSCPPRPTPARPPSS